MPIPRSYSGVRTDCSVALHVRVLNENKTSATETHEECDARTFVNFVSENVAVGSYCQWDRVAAWRNEGTNHSWHADHVYRAAAVAGNLFSANGVRWTRNIPSVLLHEQKSLLVQWRLHSHCTCGTSVNRRSDQWTLGLPWQKIAKWDDATRSGAFRVVRINWKVPDRLFVRATSVECLGTEICQSNSETTLFRAMLNEECLYAHLKLLPYSLMTAYISMCQHEDRP